MFALTLSSDYLYPRGEREGEKSTHIHTEMVGLAGVYMFVELLPGVIIPMENGLRARDKTPVALPLRAKKHGTSAHSPSTIAPVNVTG